MVTFDHVVLIVAVGTALVFVYEVVAQVVREARRPRTPHPVWIPTARSRRR